MSDQTAETSEKKPKKKSKAGYIIGGIILLIIIISLTSNGGNKNASNKSASDAATTASSQSTQSSSQTPAQPAKRQVKGTAVTLGAGTFTGGKDVSEGLYDVTTGAGQSGNFQVDGSDSYNEILGGDSSMGGVPKIRVQISSGDTITISSLSSVTFTPVTTPFVTSHAAATLYAGTFTVGQDIGAGRYVVTPGAGQSGNFQVDGSDSYNEILGGDSSMGGVPNLTANLTDGDTITISSLSQVNFAPTN